MKKVLIMPFKGFEYIMDGGQKSNKMMMKKIMVKNHDYFDNKVDTIFVAYLKKIGFLL